VSDDTAPQLSQLRGDAGEAFNFYKSVFGGEFSSVVRFKDLPIEVVDIPEEEQDKVMHIALPIGEDDILMASDTLRSLGQELVSGNNAYISVPPDQQGGGGPDLQCAFSGGRDRDAHRRPGVGGLLRRPEGQVRGPVDGELRPFPGRVNHQLRL
jgi:hypothetical protein